MTRANHNPVWDLPTRIFHWCLLPGIGFMWWTGETGRMEWHSYCAYGLICLVVSRIMWGFIGSYHARFTHFLVGPKRIIQYIREPGEVIGHNPLGALSTIALLSLLLAQGLSGLFSVDDASFEGPLAYVSDGDFIDIATEWHEVNWSLLQALIGLHLLAIAFYQFKRRQRLIQLMWFGSSETHQGVEPAKSPLLALIVLAAAAGCLWLAITMAPEPPRWY